MIIRRLADASWDGEELTPIQWIRRFRERVASKIVVFTS